MSRTHQHRPEFTLVVFDPQDAPAQVPADSRLVRDGVPRDLFGTVYRAVDTLSVVESAGGSQFIRFGQWATTHDICLDLSTGRVVQLARWPDAPVVMVNSGLGGFTEFTRLVIERFPFYPQGSEPEECAAVADELSARLAKIDPPALSMGSFWESFIEDLRNGDYSTEDVLPCLSKDE